MRFDLSSPPSLLDAFIRTRASLDPNAADSVIAFRGHLYGVVPKAGTRHLLCIEGYSVGRAVATATGYDLLTREMAVYRHPLDGPIADSFVNPYRLQSQAVHHLWNDPVNRSFTADALVADRVGDSVHLATNDFILEAHPLPPAKFPSASTGGFFESIDLARYSTTVDALETDAPSATCTFSCVRHEPWLPWMLMGEQPGHLVAHIGGAKLAGGYSALPESIKAHVEANRPEFAFAPRTFVTPNETSWTLYAKEHMRADTQRA